VAPPAEYADPDVLDISFDVLYAVVDLFKVAELVYKAILKVLPLDAVKLCVPTKSSCLKLLQIADVIAIIYSPTGLLMLLVYEQRHQYSHLFVFYQLVR